MYTYKDISDMINNDFPCKQVYYCPFGCPSFYDLFDWPCIHLANMANLADYILYWGDYHE